MLKFCFALCGGDYAAAWYQVFGSRAVRVDDGEPALIFSSLDDDGVDRGRPSVSQGDDDGSVVS